MTIHLNQLKTQHLNFSKEKNAVHLDLSEGEYQFISGTDTLNDTYFSNVYRNAIDIFEEMFSNTDDVEMIHLVINYKKKYSKTRLIDKYTQSRKYIPHHIERYQNSENNPCCAFTYKISTKNIKYSSLIKAICNQDFPPLKPIINQGSHYSELYFVNKTKNMLYLLYDDRGLWLYFDDENDYHHFTHKYHALINHLEDIL
ncbi:DUF3885 domain-containing protein [Staphylococcus hyicus]|uniref:DUF3885 domain-containing protein n=1 Tax=Staphylococcus hyicus TaxID=1284 RepID=UPI0023663A36|nr:hypothetical protein [Staphylococcus hyicus]